MCRPSVIVAVLSISALSPFGETAGLLNALADLTVGAGLIEDLSTSLAGAELPTLMDLGDSLTGFAGLDSQMLPQLSHEQRQHIEFAESFLSPFGASLTDVQGFPHLFSRSIANSSSSSSSSDTAGNSSSSSSSKSSVRYSLRGVPNPFDPAEFERLAEAIAEGVANSSVFGFRNNPFAQAAAAAAAAAKASAERGEDAPSPTAAALAVLSRLNPLTLLQLHQIYEKHRLEQQQQQQQQQPQQPQQAEEQQLLEETQQQQEETAAASLSSLEQPSERRISAAAVSTGPIDVSSPSLRASTAAGGDGVSPGEAAAAAAAAAGDAAAGAAAEGEDADEVSPSSPPQRGTLISRTNPFGPLQHWADTWGLMHWSVKNPISLLQWKSYAYALCMEIYKDADLCSKQIKTEVTASNHGGTNSPWRPSISP